MRNALQNLFHDRVDIALKSGKFGLPMFLTAGRTFFDVQLMGMGFSVVELRDSDKTDIRRMKSGLIQYENAFGGNVAYCIRDFSPKKREALIRNDIPFIAPPGQVFLPFIGIVLKNSFPKKRPETAQMSPLEQLLFLYLLYSGKEHIKAQLADALHVTRAAITKATERLSAKNLIAERKDGREVRVSLNGSPKQSFDAAKQWMIDPVSKIVYCADKPACEGFLLSGESALSEISMLSAPRNEVRSCYEKDERLSSLDLIDDARWENNGNLIRLELWKYEPEFIRDGNRVDLISMSLSLADAYDERVQGELQSAMEANGWQ